MHVRDVIEVGAPQGSGVARATVCQPQAYLIPCRDINAACT